MSRCFTWFPFGWLENPIYTTIRGCFTRIGDFTWRVSDCDELVGLLTGDEGTGNAFNKSPQSTFQILPASQSSDSTTKI